MRQLTLTLLLLLTAVTSVMATEPAEFDYMLNCQGCHLPDGMGNPQRQVPAFPGQLGLFLGVEGGREFLVQVPGSALSGLSDEGLARVLNWMLERFGSAELPDGFEPYSAAEVTRWRADVPADVDAVRAELIGRIEQQQLSRESLEQ